MTPFDFVLIACTIISTSFISGLFGMAGGMILVGVLLVYFDVATGMVIFSIIQFVANGWRAVLWWRFVLWRIFFVYVSGAVHLVCDHALCRDRSEQGGGLSRARRCCRS